MPTENTTLFNYILIPLMCIFGGKDVSKPFLLKSGDKFGHFTLTGNHFFKGTTRYVECVCVCGNVGYRSAAHVKKGTSKSCGCKMGEEYRKTDIANGNSLTGSDVKQPLYGVWTNIKNRCLNKKNISHKNYGGRGIGICKEWKNNFSAFYTWAINNGWKRGLTIDRFPDQNGDYSPLNCRVATWKQQQRNKRNNVIVEAFGEKKCISDWFEDKRCVVTRQILYNRKRDGWEMEAAIITKSTGKNGRN